MDTKRIIFSKNIIYEGEVYDGGDQPYGLGAFSFCDSGLSFEAKCNWYKGQLIDFDTIKVIKEPHKHCLLIQLFDIDDGVGGYTSYYFNELLAYCLPIVGKIDYKDMESIFARSNDKGIRSYFEILEISEEGIKIRLSDRLVKEGTEPVQFIKFGEHKDYGWLKTHTHIWEHDEEFETEEVHKLNVYLF